jgi:hypothetical protein
MLRAVGVRPLGSRLGRRERAYACHTGATEDNASGRAALPDGTRPYSAEPSYPSAARSSAPTPARASSVNVTVTPPMRVPSTSSM